MEGPIEVSADYSEAVKREIQIRRGHFIEGFLEVKRGTSEEAEKTWEKLQKAKAQYRELEERSAKELLSWSLLEKPLKEWLQSEGCDEETIQKTILSYKRSFETNQCRVRERSGIIFDVDADFLKALETGDEEKLHLYLHRPDSDDFIKIAIIHFSKKRKWR